MNSRFPNNLFTTLAQGDLTSLRQLSPSDWDTILQLATRHGIAPLLYGQLRSSPLQAALPTATLQSWKRRYLDAAAASLRWQHQLQHLLEFLHASSIPAVLVGETHLASLCYENAAFRPLRTLDFLIPAGILPVLAGQLLEMGYILDPAGGTTDPSRAAAFFIPLKDADLPVRLYGHFLEPEFPFQADDASIWAHTYTVPLGRLEVAVLRPELLLLQRCLVDIPDLPETCLRLSFDLARIAERYRAEMEWGDLSATARRWQIGETVHLALHLARDLVGAPIPDEVLLQLEPPAFDTACMARITQGIFASPGVHFPAPSAPGAPDAGIVDEALLALSPRNPLIQCLRGRWNTAAFDVARDLMAASTPDWDAWVGTAVRGGVASLLAVTLCDPRCDQPCDTCCDPRRDPRLVPLAVLSAWEDRYIWHLRRNTRTLRELARLLRALRAAGIETLLLKGAALGVAVYRNVGLRPMGDIDLLVRHEDAARALAILEGLGYAAFGAETRPGASLEYENEVALRHPEHVTPVELHWDLLDSPHYQSVLDMRWFWNTALPVEFEGVSALILGPEAQLLHLCSHLMLHHGGASGHLLWYHDIAEVLVAYGAAINWDLLFSAAVTSDLILSLQKVLPEVWTCWQLEPPPGIREVLAALQPSTKESQLFQQLTAPARPVAQRFATDLASMRSWRQRLRYAWENIVPSPTYIRDRYHVSHPSLLPFYYLWRWLRGILSVLGRKR